MNMKKIFLILTLLIGLYSCKNFDVVHPDFEFTSGYFPYQFPVRTLILGDYIYDNTNDNAQKFVISVAMGGVYENNKDREFEFQVDNSLCNNILFTANGDPVVAMPNNYYTLSSSNKIVIPRGKFNGGVEVQLTEAFFNDPNAIKNSYVIPLRLKSSKDVDKILVGQTNNPKADPRVPGDWTVAPKDFTMFAVKYINEYHGTYFQYGTNTVKNAAGSQIESTTYSTPFVENNTTATLTTIGRKQVSLSVNYRSLIMTGSYSMILSFTGNNCTVTAAPGASYTITGSGEFKTQAYEWGNKKRDGIVLKYTVSTATNKYEADEVLVIRDRAVVMEVYNPVVK